MEFLDSRLGREPYVIGATLNRTLVHFLRAVGVIIDDVRAHDPSLCKDFPPC
jgi:hypothetical protein